MASRIREYENTEILRPNDRGVSATANAAEAAATSGYRIGQMLKQTGSEIEGAARVVGDAAGNYYTKTVVQPEIAKGGVVGAGVLMDLTQQWNALASSTNPNDTTIAQTFLEKTFNPAMEKFKQGFTTAEGQKWADDYSTRLLGHMQTKIMADSATRAGHAAALNMETLENQLSATAMRDPSSHDFLQQQAVDAVKGIVRNTPGLDASTAAKLETDLLAKTQKTIAQAAISGMAQTNPEAAEKVLQSGKFSKYLNGVEEAKYVKSMIAFQRSEARAEREEKRRQTTDKANTTINELVLNSVQPDGTVKVTPEFFTTLKKGFAGLAEGNPTLLRTALDWGQKIQDRGKDINVATDPGTYRALSLKLINGDLKLEDILKAGVDQKLSDKDQNQLIGNLQHTIKDPFQDRAFSETLKAAERMVKMVEVPGIPGQDSVGAAKYAGFINSFLPKYLAAKRENKLQENALDLQDENSMIRKAMEPYKRSRAQMLQDYVGGFDKMKEITGVTPNENLPKAPAAPVVPENLQNIKDLMYSPKDGVFVDPATKTRYDKDGKAK